MNHQWIDEIEVETELSPDSSPNLPKTVAPTKLDRRRRIEDLNDEKRLRDELGQF